MRTILLSKEDEAYLQKCGAQLAFTFGIIIGQEAEPEKFVVVHLAKNGEEDVDLPDSEDDADAVAEHASHGPQSVDDIDTQALTNQWISAFKMIPGSFQVLGIFVAGVKPSLVEELTFTSAKKLLYDVHNLLIQSKNVFSSIDDVTSSEYLFLSYSTTTRKSICKNYTHALNGGTFTPMDCRFVEKPFEWYTFECSYELDDVFPIIDATQRINIEDQFQKTITAVRKSLDVSEIFIQNESVDDRLTLADYNKKRLSNRAKGSVVGNASEILKATIFLPVKCQISSKDEIKVRQFNGTIRFLGVISSRIWCNPKNTLGDVKRFVRDDILRSLAARIQVYCDGLTETNVSHEAIFISEPPRRVYFNLPSASGVTNPIQFSEYIFRGEAPTVAVAQAKQILDLDVNSEAIFADLEGLPDDETFSDFSMSDLEASTGAAGGGKPKAAPTKSERDLSRTMYMLGIAVSLLVLIVSILLHYMLQK